MSAKGPMIFVLALATVAGCRPDDQRTNTIDPMEAMRKREELRPEAIAQLDSGTQAFRAENFEAALAHYQKVTELDPESGSGWFGVYMAHSAMGDDEAAAQALERAQSAVPGASLIHPTRGDTIP